MDKKRIKSIIAGTALAAVLSSPVAIGAAVVINVGHNTPMDYESTASVEYNGDKYKLFDLYKLTSLDGEEHICRLDISRHINYGRKIIGIGPRFIEDPGVYIDIDSGEDITIEGEEQESGYEVEKIADLFPFEEYGSKEVVVIPQDEFESVVGKGPSMHR